MSATLYREAVRDLLRQRLHGYIKSPEMFREMAKAQQQYQLSVSEAQRIVAEVMREPTHPVKAAEAHLELSATNDATGGAA
jgi:hypothetical protein